LRNHYRRRGLGAPISAHIEPRKNTEKGQWIPRQAKLPGTVLLVFDDAAEGLRTGQLRASVEIYDANRDPFAQIQGRTIPLETDTTTALAYRLEGSPVWDFEIAGFRRGDFTPFGRQDSSGLYMIEPYRPGRIPVIFVHGTASSPARWAQMANELQSDARLAAAYQLWFFIYNTGNPIALSASKLRDGIKALVADVDPEGKDAALNRMVLIGHSQGGLIVRLMVIDSGTRFWENVSSTPFEEAKLSPETRKLMQDTVFFEHVPNVERVIFCATPHRGALLAENWIGNLGRRLIRMPATLLNVTTDLLTLQAPGLLRDRKMPTAVDNMRSTHPFIVALGERPIAPRVRVNSIVAVKGDGPPEEGNDGVVAYKSAHFDNPESEIVVRSSHSVQENPVAIEEVRRILYEHLGLGAGAHAKDPKQAPESAK
jgi:pimeloyl-ACP methyl ester carboxylesterase